MKRTFYFFAIIFSLMTAYAQDTKEVLSKGFGTTVDWATQNALSQAVREAVGALVDEETLIKNDELIEEKILTFSNGIVQDYKIVKEPRKNAQGLLEITIKATVKSNLLKKKLEEAKIITGTVENGDEIWRNAMAQIMTEAQTKENALAVIQKLLNSIEPEQFLSVTLIDKDGNLNEDAKLEIKPNLENKTAEISIYAVIHIDYKKYFNNVFPYVKQTLDYACENKYESLVVDVGSTDMTVFQDKNKLTFISNKDKIINKRVNNEIIDIGNNILNGFKCSYIFERYERAGYWKKKEKGQKSYIYLQTNKRASNSQIIFTEYVFQPEIQNIFKDLNKKLSLELFVYDKDKEIISQNELLGINYYRSNVSLSYYGMGGIREGGGADIINGRKKFCILGSDLSECYILPMLFAGGTFGGALEASNQFPLKITLKLPLDDIKDIASFDVKISMKRK